MYQLTLTPARAATSSRRKPGVRRSPLDGAERLALFDLVKIPKEVVAGPGGAMIVFAHRLRIDQRKVSARQLTASADDRYAWGSHPSRWCSLWGLSQTPEQVVDRV